MAAEYKNLQTPKALKGTRPTDQDYLNRDMELAKKPKAKKNEELLDLQ